MNTEPENITVMLDKKRLIFLHGLDSNSQTYKATLLRAIYLDLIVPDFVGTLDNRMRQLQPILADHTNWTLIGSSYGGLMAALFATEHPMQVRKLVLLAPALFLTEFANHLHHLSMSRRLLSTGGRIASFLSLPINSRLRRFFAISIIELVDDDHRLHRPRKLDWKSILNQIKLETMLSSSNASRTSNAQKIYWHETHPNAIDGRSDLATDEKSRWPSWRRVHRAFGRTNDRKTKCEGVCSRS